MARIITKLISVRFIQLISRIGIDLYNRRIFLVGNLRLIKVIHPRSNNIILKFISNSHSRYKSENRHRIIQGSLKEGQATCSLS